jgi:hypothetical protein
MPAEIKKEIEQRSRTPLFIDIVAYSKLSINEQFRKAEAAKPNLKDPHPQRHGAGLLQEPEGTGMLKGQRKRLAPKI